MKFPKTLRAGEGAYAGAVKDLDEARATERRLIDNVRTARATLAELPDEQALGTARDQVSAREAWVAWIKAGH